MFEEMVVALFVNEDPALSDFVVSRVGSLVIYVPITTHCVTN